MAKQPLARRICRLLSHERAELTSAAALILGELGEAEVGVVEALGGCLANGHSAEVQCYVLEALEKIGSRASLPYVLPLLNGPEELRERAARVVIGLGQPAAKEIVKQLLKRDWAERRACFSILARMRTASAVRSLLDGLAREPSEHVEEFLPALRSELRVASAKERAAVRTVVERYLASSSKARSSSESIVALRVLGFLDDAAAWPIVVGYAKPTAAAAVRHAALLALASIPRPPRTGTAVVDLFSALAESDLDGVVRPALRVLAPIPFGPANVAALRDLLAGPHEDVKRFALEKLGGIDDPRAAESLVDAVHSSEPELRDVAGRALGRLASAVPLLLDRLIAESDAERAWRLARIVRSRPDALNRSDLKRLGDRLVRHLDHDSRLYEPFVFLLADVAPAKTREVLLERARRKKRSRRFADTVLSLRILERHRLFDAEIRYELAVALTKMASSHDDPDDPALQLFASVVGEEFAFFERARRETVLTADDLARIGVALLNKNPAGKDVGAQILRLVMRKSPRSALARDARACLDRNGIR